LGAPGLAIFLNHWIGLLWIAVLHLLWHLVISIEERSMVAQFGQEYLTYARHTGRFIPRLFSFRDRAWPIPQPGRCLHWRLPPPLVQFPASLQRAAVGTACLLHTL